jgi:hypothetical protein
MSDLLCGSDKINLNVAIIDEPAERAGRLGPDGIPLSHATT